MVEAERSLRSSERVEPEEFSRRISSRLGERAGDLQVRFGQIWTTVPPGEVPELLRALKDEPELSCRYFTFLSAVDWQDRGFEVLIMVFSIEHSATVRISCWLPAEDPRMPTVTGIFQSAEWHERETFEMFGIVFEGHDNLRNLYLADDFEGFPLRKSFRLASRAFKPWPGAKDPAEAEAGGR